MKCFFPCTVVAALLATSSAWSDVQYTIADLGTVPGGVSSAAYDVNNRGQVIGYSMLSSG
jgi:hypothetical protein